MPELSEDNMYFLTNANDFLNLDTGGVNLFGELTDGLVWVLVGKGVNIYPHTWKKEFARKKGGKQKRKRSE